MTDREVSVAEAQERLSELVDDAERGETLAITRDGREVARLTPPEPNGATTNPGDTADDARARRKVAVQEFLLESDQADWAHGRVTLEEIREWISEGRA